MKVLLDTNVVLDVVLKRETFFESSFKIFQMIQNKTLEGGLSAKSIIDINYFARKKMPKVEVEPVLKILIRELDIISIGKKEMEKAFTLNFDDFEDALVSVCANKYKAEYIVTRDKWDFQKSKTPAIMPDSFLNQFKTCSHH